MRKVVCILLFTFLNCFLMAQSMQSDYAVKWANSLEYTLAVAQKMPASEYDFRPIDTIGMTFGEQLLHLGDNARWLALNKLRGNTRPTKAKVDPNDKEAVIAYVKESYAIAESVLESLTFSELDEPVKWSGGSISKRRISLLIFDHSAHHRAQAIMYLRLNGIEPPRYIGW